MADTTLVKFNGIFRFAYFRLCWFVIPELRYKICFALYFEVFIVILGGKYWSFFSALSDVPAVFFKFQRWLQKQHWAVFTFYFLLFKLDKKQVNVNLVSRFC